MGKLGAPAPRKLNRFAVNRNKAVEAVKQNLYDSQTYAQAGQSVLTFFQTPVGQSSKTYADTNMSSAGQLPNPQKFLVQGIRISFFPGVDPAAFGTGAKNEFIDDLYAFGKSGYLDFFIGSKSYLTEGPMFKFPDNIGLAGFAALADTTTAAADRHSSICYAAMRGMYYRLKPNIMLEPTQNFNVSLNWPVAVALSAAARVVITLDGIMYRKSQ